jgi:hypothetical protein
MTKLDDLTYPDAREQKLPRWAQEKLVGLRRELSNTQGHTARAIASVQGSIADPFAWVDPYGDHPLPVAGGFDRIALTTGGNPREGVSWVDHRNEVHLSPESRDGTWMLMAPYGGLFVRPSSSNVAYVGVWN